MLDRYVEQLLRVDSPEPPRAWRLERERAAARERASRDPAFAECPRRVTREQIDCALASTYADALERCLIPIP